MDKAARSYVVNAGPRRPDGFPGQRLVIIPKSVQSAAAKNPLLRGLLVTDAGYFPRAAGHYMERAEGAATHLLISCLRGRGWVSSRSGRRAIRAGDLVWLRANEAHAYGADDVEPWTIGWIHFTGEEAESWRNYVGFPPEPTAVLRRVSAKALAALKLEEIHLVLEEGYAVPALVSAAIMLRAALNLAAKVVREGGPTSSATERIAAVRDHLRDHLDQPHRLGELAASAGLSVPHFSVLFRRQTGYAPIDFLMHQRVQRACVLLDTSDATVSTIAAQVGYGSPFYFSRCFRRIVGCSPRAYRRVAKG